MSLSTAGLSVVIPSSVSPSVENPLDDPGRGSSMHIDIDANQSDATIPRLEITLSEALRVAQAARELVDRMERLANQLEETRDAIVHTRLFDQDPADRIQEAKDEAMGYVMPDIAWMDKVDRDLTWEHGAGSKLKKELDQRSARRDARIAAREQHVAMEADRSGYASAMPTKVAEKREAGQVRVDRDTWTYENLSCDEGESDQTRRNRDVAHGVARQSATKCDSLADLTDEQRRAIPMLMIGKSDAAVAHAIGVHRGTIHRWRQTEAFRAALSHSREQIWGAGMDKVRAMSFESLGVMRRFLKDKNQPQYRFQAAKLLVQMIGAKRLTPERETGETEAVSSGKETSQERSRAA